LERKEAQLTDEARHALGEHGPLRQRVHVHLCDLLQDRRGGGGRKGTGLLLRGALRARCPMSRRGGRWRRARRDLTRRRRAHRHRQASSRGGALPKASQDRSHPGGGGGGAPRGIERERGESEGEQKSVFLSLFSFHLTFLSRFLPLPKSSELKQLMVRVSFNQDSSCLALADRRGIRVWSLGRGTVVFEESLGGVR